MKKFNKEFCTLGKGMNGDTGFMLDSLPSHVMSALGEEISNVQNDFENSVRYNKYLVGQIDKEYEIKLSNTTSNYLKDSIGEYLNHFNLINYYKSFFIDGEVNFSDQFPAWVNFQEKHEYNPPHFHTGLISYVIWYKIPYTYEDESKYGPGIKTPIDDNTTTRFAESAVSYNGTFVFYMGGNEANIVSEILSVDRTWEGTLAVFPSSLNHAVFPFYTSDDYRITVAGNIHFA